MNHLLFYGVACVGAVIVAALSYDERRTLTLSALAVLVSWAVFAMPWIYAPASYEFVTAGAGFQRPQEEAWAMADLAGLALTACTGHRVWWGMALPTTFFAMLLLHLAAFVGGWQFVEYASVLNVSFVTQLVIIYAIGGGGACDRLRACWRVHILPRLPILAPYLAGQPR